MLHVGKQGIITSENAKYFTTRTYATHTMPSTTKNETDCEWPGLGNT